MSKKHKDETDLIRNQLERTGYREHSAPIFLTSSFTFSDADEMAMMFAGEKAGDIYSRYANPNTGEFIDKMCQLEGADAGFATASGMAAVWSSMAGVLESGDHILASRALFGSTHQLLTQILPRFGISHTYVDPLAIDSWSEDIRKNSKMLLLETPSNPSLFLVDLQKAASFAQHHQLILNVDNCFSTPILQKPLLTGADIVTHSGTKYIDGQGRVLGGIILGTEELMEKISLFCRHTGPAMSPFNAWILSKSLETLPIRMQRHCDNALEVANFLNEHPKIKEVRYPHLPNHPQYTLARRQMSMGGGVVSFIVQDGLKGARTFLDNIRMCSLSANLGDSRTIVTHPTTTTHSKLSSEERESVGISDGMVRISVGLEHIDDIILDLDTALSPC